MPTCPHCGAFGDNDRVICVECREPFPSAVLPRWRDWMLAALVIVVAAVALLVRWLVYHWQR